MRALIPEDKIQQRVLELARQIQRDYQELHGYPLASSSRSQSKRPMIGTTVLQIDYENYRISP